MELTTLKQDCLDLVPELRHLSLDASAVERVAEKIAVKPPELPKWDHPAFPAEAGPELDAVVWLGNAINFCYWGDLAAPQWTVEIDGVIADDAFAVFAAVRRALQDGVDLRDGRTLDGYARALLDVGENDLPLSDKRVDHLREIGALLTLEFGGDLQHAVAAAGTSAPAHAVFLARTFRAFRDERRYHGRRLPFLKRAQLAAGMLHAARLSRGAPGLTDADQLTVYADYMVPRVLRDLGVLQYGDPLAARIDAMERIPACTDEETEIRIATVAAGAMIVDHARALGADVTTLQLDYWMWRRGFDVTAPHHRTLTSDY